MRIIFAGTPDFSVPALEALIDAGHRIVAVYTQPDRRAGRGRKTVASPVKRCAEKHNIPIEQPATLKDDEARIRSYNADLMVVVAYGLLLPENILQLPEHGCLNIHASLLPRWRGAAPIHRAIEAGDKETGITIMQMDAGLDTGDILAQYPITPDPSETGQSLHDKLARLGASAITEVVASLDEYQQNAEKQQNSLSTYAKKITKQESNIDWTESSSAIERRIRAFTPWPGTQTWYQNTKLRLSQAEHSEQRHNSEPGMILSADKTGIQVACGEGVLIIKQLQRPGGKPLQVVDFLNGMTLEPGIKLQHEQNDE